MSTRHQKTQEKQRQRRKAKRQQQRQQWQEMAHSRYEMTPKGWNTLRTFAALPLTGEPLPPEALQPLYEACGLEPSAGPPTLCLVLLDACEQCGLPFPTGDEACDEGGSAS